MMPGFGFGCGSFGMFGWWGLILNAVFGIVILAGLIWLAVWTVRRFNNGNHTNSGITAITQSTSAIEQAQLRYARGEITREQYQQILADISQ